MLAGVLASSVSSVGETEERLCDTRHPLALTYALYSPQKQAAVAEVLRVAAAPDTDIFADLNSIDQARLAEHIRDCILATNPSALASLSRQLVVARSHVCVAMAESRVGADSAHRGTRTLLDVSPDLAMRAVAALAVLHHGVEGPQEWRDGEELRIRQEMRHLEEDLKVSVLDFMGQKDVRPRQHEKGAWRESGDNSVMAPGTHVRVAENGAPASDLRVLGAPAGHVGESGGFLEGGGLSLCAAVRRPLSFPRGACRDRCRGCGHHAAPGASVEEDTGRGGSPPGER